VLLWHLQGLQGRTDLCIMCGVVFKLYVAGAVGFLLIASVQFAAWQCLTCHLLQVLNTVVLGVVEETDGLLHALSPHACM